MSGVQRGIRQKVVVGAAVAVLLGGAAFAAVSATGKGNGHRQAHAAARRKLHRQDLAAAAAYLGLSEAQLSARLAAGSSLAQIAAARGQGKSAQGLITAIVASRKGRLQRATVNLPRRVGAEVARPGDPTVGAARPGKHGKRAQRFSALTLLLAPGHIGTAAANYLGTSSAQLRQELRRGQTLAQLAEADSHHSKAGLIAAILAARRQKLSGAVAPGASGQARSARRLEHAQKRIERLVDRKFAPAPSA